MIIRRARAEDAEAIRSVLVAAFPSTLEAELVERLRRDGDAEIELVAERNGRLVGHILFSPVKGPLLALALAPLSVHPEDQRSGIGSALIEAGHQAARSGGWSASFVLGEPAYYARFGYSAQLAEPFSSPYSGPFFQMLELTSPQPASSGEIRYAPAFMALG